MGPNHTIINSTMSKIQNCSRGPGPEGGKSGFLPGPNAESRWASSPPGLEVQSTRGGPKAHLVFSPAQSIRGGPEAHLVF